jgi:uncharacterized protein with HEPN domain
MSRNVLVYIKDILQNMRDAEQFIQGMTYEQFVADKKTMNAVLRSIEVIVRRLNASLMMFALNIPKSPGKKWQGCGIRLSTSISA